MVGSHSLSIEWETLFELHWVCNQPLVVVCESSKVQFVHVDILDGLFRIRLKLSKGFMHVCGLWSGGR